MRSISMDEFLTLKDVSVIDVREDVEYKDGHIPNSIHISLFELEDRLHELEKNKRYYMICRSGSRSLHACQIATNKGYDVVNVMGGMSVYRGEISYELWWEY